MRDRLIKLLRDSGCSDEFETFEDIADYLIENGVIVPPCKVGDKIYYIGDGDVQELNIEFITITENGLEYGVNFGDNTIPIYEFWVGKKLYYYTKEEAEKALRGDE